MTTVDVTVTATDRDERFSASNGLFGPASNLLYEVGRRVPSGEAEGTFDGGSVDALCSGELILQTVRNSPDEGFRIDGTPASRDDVLALVRPEGRYRVWGVEF